MTGPCRILYQSPRLRAVYQPAESEWLAFSFNGGEFSEAGERFFGDTYFAKRNIAAIGFVDNDSRWFPREDMQAALQAIRAAVPDGSYRRSVTYGVSMGAYGALKYGRMLGAHAALAFGPQWSINPALVARFDDRYERFFDPVMHAGMEIGADDLCPNNYIFFDPLFSPDVNHAALISRHPDVSCTVHTFLGHPGIAYFTRTRLIDNVFELARQDAPDRVEFRRLIRSKRAGSRVYWLGRAEWLKRKHGLGRLRWLVESFERAQAVTDVPDDHTDAIEALVLLAKALLDAGQQERANEHLALLWEKAQAGATHHDLSQLFVRMGAFDRARYVAERAVQHNPHNPRARLELVRTLIDIGDLQRANVEVDVIRGFARERPVIWRNLRLLYSRLGRTEDVAVADSIIAKMAFTKKRQKSAGAESVNGDGPTGGQRGGAARKRAASTAPAEPQTGRLPTGTRFGGRPADRAAMAAVDSPSGTDPR
jgi:hypothetical protein